MSLPKQDVTKGCHALIPGFETSYGYEPSFPAGVVFAVIFFLSLAGHAFRSVQYRKAASILLVISALTEVLGWSARTWSSKCPYNSSAFMMQIITLVVAPVFVTAALYVMLGDLIRARGEHFSLLKPKLYVLIFCICDVIALVVQATGAAMASHAFDTGQNTKPGALIVAGGVIFQLFTMLVFAALFVMFLVRSSAGRTTRPQHPAAPTTAAAAGGVQSIPLKETSAAAAGRRWPSHLDDDDDDHHHHHHHQDRDRLRAHHDDDDDQLGTAGVPAKKKKHTVLTLAMWFSFVAVYVRSVFRAIQLIQGFRGYLATHEEFFIGLDGVVMFLAIAVFNFVNPYIL